MFTMNYDLEKKAFAEFKGWRVKKSNSYSVSLERTVKKNNEEKTEELVVYASYFTFE